MSSRSKYSRKKMLMPMTLTTIVAAAAAGGGALRARLGISSVGIGHSTDSFNFAPVIPETQAYLDSMTVYLREQLTENKEN